MALRASSVSGTDMREMALKIAKYHELPVFDPAPFGIWLPDQTFSGVRISDYAAALTVIDGYRTGLLDHASRAPIYFRPGGMSVRAGIAGFGQPFVYEGAFVTYGNYVMKGASDLKLPFGRDIRLLCQDQQFIEWIDRVIQGQYAMFNFSMLKCYPDVLISLTSPSMDGNIGSGSPHYPRPFFGLPASIFDATISAPPIPFSIAIRQVELAPPATVQTIQQASGISSDQMAGHQNHIHISLMQALQALVGIARAGDIKTATEELDKMKILLEGEVSVAEKEIARLREGSTS